MIDVYAAGSKSRKWIKKETPIQKILIVLSIRGLTREIRKG